MKLFGSFLIFFFTTCGLLAQQISGTYSLPTAKGQITLNLILQGEQIAGKLTTDDGSTYNLSGYGEEDIAEGTIQAANGNQMLFEAYVANSSELEFTIVPYGSIGPDYDKAQEFVLKRVEGNTNIANNQNNQAEFGNLQQQTFNQSQNNINNTSENYHGTINGVTCSMQLNVQGNNMSGKITDNSGYQYNLKGQIQGMQMNGKMTDTGTNNQFDFQANKNGNNIAMLVMIPNQYGQIQQLNLQFTKGNPPVQQQNTGLTGNSNGQIDNRLVGAWSNSSTSNSGNFSMSSSVTLQLNQDGTYFYGNGRVVFGGASSFGDTGQDGSGNKGKWKIQNKTIYITDGQANQWYPFAGYYLEGYKLLLKFADGSKQIWYRK